MILIDTSVWIDFFRGVNSPQRWMLHTLIQDEDDIAICGIILTEILQGVKEDKKFQQINEYLLELSVYEPKGIETYRDAARIFRLCRKQGKTIRSTIDCLIAAVCIENNLSILHKNQDYDAICQCSSLKVLKA